MARDRYRRAQRERLKDLPWATPTQHPQKFSFKGLNSHTQTRTTLDQVKSHADALMWDFSQDPHYGTHATVDEFGNDIIVTTDPHAIEAIVTSHIETFGKR